MFKLSISCPNRKLRSKLTYNYNESGKARNWKFFMKSRNKQF